MDKINWKYFTALADETITNKLFALIPKEIFGDAKKTADELHKLSEEDREWVLNLLDKLELFNAKKKKYLLLDNLLHIILVGLIVFVFVYGYMQKGQYDLVSYGVLVVVVLLTLLLTKISKIIHEKYLWKKMCDKDL